jgi:hypothetical protein
VVAGMNDAREDMRDREQRPRVGKRDIPSLMSSLRPSSNRSERSTASF